MSEPCALIGILDDGWSGLSAGALARLVAADLVIGAQRTLDLIAGGLKSDPQKMQAMDGQLGRVPEWIRAAREAGRSVAVLATGDPLCHGIASFLIGKLGADAIDVLPAVSTLQLAFARLKKTWQTAKIVSVHSRDAGEWNVGATPDQACTALCAPPPNIR